jgi:signal transduction histidine kinase
MTKQQETVFINDINTIPDKHLFPSQIPLKSLVATPIKIKGEIIGIIEGDMQYHTRNMDSQDVARFEMFANMVALALDNIRAYESLELKVRQRTDSLIQTNKELLEKTKELEQTTYELASSNIDLLTAHEKLEETNKELRDTQAKLFQTEKMASLGLLVAGIAHEINTPVGAINSMHDTLVRAIKKLQNEINLLIADAKEAPPEITSSLKIITEGNRVIKTATDRVINIVRKLKSFARLDEAELKRGDIHDGLEDTLTLIHHEIKHNIEVVKQYGRVPTFAFYPGRLNQVFLNLLMNAKQAIRGKGKIIITTFVRNDNVYIKIKDTGVGIVPEHLEKIFDPGFTTKGVGIGTGLGLSICYQIIQDHKGEITVDSKPGIGSTFTLQLPLGLNND